MVFGLQVQPITFKAGKIFKFSHRQIFKLIILYSFNFHIHTLAHHHIK